MTPPYIGPLPGTKLTFRESMAQERPSEQQWPHRPMPNCCRPTCCPDALANLVVDCMRAYGATTMGVLANVGGGSPNGRAILGFISYGYAQMLLRLDRIEEYLLFSTRHRYHDHTPGSWTAGEVAGITGGKPIFCIPAQQTIPLLVRWMLVLEDPTRIVSTSAKDCRARGSAPASRSTHRAGAHPMGPSEFPTAGDARKQFGRCHRRTRPRRSAAGNSGEAADPSAAR